MRWSDVFGEMHPKLLVSFACGAGIYLTVIGFLVAWRDSMPALAAVLGAVVGWAGGILLAPYSEEKLKFNGWAKGISGLIAGISITEARNALNALPPESKATLAGQAALRSYLVFLICVLTAAIVVFVARSYWQSTERDVDDDDEPNRRSASAGRHR